MTYGEGFPRDRASLELPRGHLSLTDLHYQDSGRYMCYVTYINTVMSETRLIVNGQCSQDQLILKSAKVFRSEIVENNFINTYHRCLIKRLIFGKG